jgi:uncharacterized protein
MSQANPHHKARHRKKLRLGEFQELGFAVSASCPGNWSDEQREQAMGGLLDLIEERELDYGGGDSASGMDGYIVASERGSASNDDRAAVRARLEALGFADIKVGELEDAWYPMAVE